MASLKEMRNRIGSVKATQKITKAMQMVAAAKSRRAQDAAQSARPYARRMASVIANLAKSVSGPSAPPLLAGTGKDQKHPIVVAARRRASADHLSAEGGAANATNLTDNGSNATGALYDDADGMARHVEIPFYL